MRVPDEGSVDGDAVDLPLRRAAAVDARFTARSARMRCGSRAPWPSPRPRSTRVPLLRTALDTAVERSDDEAHAYATQYLGLAHLFAGDLATACDMFEQAYRMHLELGSNTAAFALSDLAVTAMLTGDSARAIVLYEEVWPDRRRRRPVEHVTRALGVRRRQLPGRRPAASRAS